MLKRCLQRDVRVVAVLLQCCCRRVPCCRRRALCRRKVRGPGDGCGHAQVWEKGAMCRGGADECVICNDITVCPHCFIGPKVAPAKRREVHFDR